MSIEPVFRIGPPFEKTQFDNTTWG